MSTKRYKPTLAAYWVVLISAKTNPWRQAVKYSFLHPEEAETASCVVTRLFKTDDSDTLTLVTAGIGDGMVAVFNPQLFTVTTLIQPRQYDRGIQFTPVSVTENLAKSTLQCVACQIPAGSVLLRMTDGAWESLPHRRSEVLMDSVAQKRYLDYTLDETQFGELLKDFAEEYPTATAANYREYLQSRIQQYIENQKAQLLQQQADLQSKLKTFHGTTTSKLGDFITWASQHNANFRLQFYQFLKTLNISNENIEQLLLSVLEDQLQHIQLGDDICINVEITENPRSNRV